MALMSGYLPIAIGIEPGTLPPRTIFFENPERRDALTGLRIDPSKNASFTFHPFKA